MIDGKPIWEHLLDNKRKEVTSSLDSYHYGKFAEIIGKKFLESATRREGGLLKDLFPDINILSTRRVNMGNKNGDFVIIIDCEKDGEFSKKVALFEIKHGKVCISQNQLRRYCHLIKFPYMLASKADELRVFYLIFSQIMLNTISEKVDFSICELTKEFAEKISNGKSIKD